MQFYKTSVLAFGTTSLETAERMNHLAEQWRKCWKRLIDDIYIYLSLKNISNICLMRKTGAGYFGQKEWHESRVRLHGISLRTVNGLV